MAVRREGTITDVKGIRAAGVACGIKPDGRKDLALIVSKVPGPCAGTFTTNYVKAAPVILTMRRVREQGVAQAIVANSGNANCCTGERGLKDAREMAKVTAEALGIPERLVLVCSTGRIGKPLPMARIRKGIKEAVKALSEGGGLEAAEAITTTDTRPKHGSVTIRLPGGRATIGAICKGAGMIHPNMATMLCFVATDAELSRALLQKALSEAVSLTFNRISVDGDRSTNDTVLLLSNGLSGTEPIRGRGEAGFSKFKGALT
ncbi:MAG TPA: bifunctional ornithine acetyltransferase/N-acetylglutamate synthase, partial [Armatimonadetes bacterium]|nr:bifunctional ornithine acetyltransferase/N-acetylglutamate synthase [Armatimonadota bacterium]